VGRKDVRRREALVCFIRARDLRWRREFWVRDGWTFVGEGFTVWRLRMGLGADEEAGRRGGSPPNEGGVGGGGGMGPEQRGGGRKVKKTPQQLVKIRNYKITKARRADS
jgi:hypothetical protein